MKVRTSDNISAAYSSYCGNIKTTANELTKVFGKNNRNFSPDGKVTREWILEFTLDTGEIVIATIYDWKTNGIDDDQEYDWHIGGYSHLAVYCVTEYFNSHKE